MRFAWVQYMHLSRVVVKQKGKQTGGNAIIGQTVKTLYEVCRTPYGPGPTHKRGSQFSLFLVSSCGPQRDDKDTLRKDGRCDPANKVTFPLETNPPMI